MSVSRINAIRKALKAENLDGFIVNDLSHIRYLTGFTGSAGLLAISRTQALLMVDFRYTDQARKQSSGVKVVQSKGTAVSELKNHPEFNARNMRYGVHSEAVNLTTLDTFEQALPDSLVVRSDKIMAELGWVKDKSEVVSIKKAVRISDTAFERILALVAPGIRERELAAELEYQMMMLGSEKPAFETIVASGWRAALPHGIASDKKLKKGDFVTFDFGAVCDGYCSDITRTVVVGKADSRQKKIYKIVAQAQLAGIRKVKAGVAAKAVDDACRKPITRAGYGKNFGHGTGHGIGIVIHTGPRVSPVSDDKLKPGNVITVEPGIYISGWGGVRIEDDVLVTRSGGQVLNKAEKKLLEL